MFLQVASVWSTKFGIILERVCDVNNSFSDASQLPTMFALFHPLDEVSPVLSKYGKIIDDDYVYNKIYVNKIKQYKHSGNL